jgi:hypothetical protein
MQKDGGWMVLPKNYFDPNQAIKFWLTEHGHIPKLWNFRCDCGRGMISGGQVALEMGWDDFMLAQNDIGWCARHAHHSGMFIDA